MFSNADKRKTICQNLNIKYFSILALKTENKLYFLRNPY